MTGVIRVLPLLAVLLLAGCASQRLGTTTSSVPVATATTLPTVNTAALPDPVQRTADALSMTDISAFIDPAALAIMSAKERTEATSAQFYALDVGRVGAPRNWSGDTGSTGVVTVGPYVTVNNIACRNFTHTVTIAGKAYSREGQACREPTGRWAAVS
jgi:surface antigen